MTYPDDPRDRSWDDGTANPPPERPDSEPSTEAWQAYPDSEPLPEPDPYENQPTQQHPTQQYPGQQYPGQQYPAGQQYPVGQQYPNQNQPTEQYPAAPQYSGQQHPGQQHPGQPLPGQPYPGQPYGYQQQPYAQPNPTQVFPQYDPNQQYAGGNYGQPPSTGAETPYTAGDSGSGGNSPRKWIFALIALAALAVVVLAGILVVTNRDSEPSTALRSPSTMLAPQPTSPQSQSPQSQSPLTPPTTSGGLLPGGIPEILGGAGAAVGTITAIDGSTLSIQGIDGAPVTVLITPQTQILSLSGFDASSLKVGSLVVVNGSPMQNGSITADVIVETPDLGG